ncbi:MAG: hypothetical protein ACRDNK_18765, partial [Solirubrobacteraceae bacterium]
GLSPSTPATGPAAAAPGARAAAPNAAAAHAAPRAVAIRRARRQARANRRLHALVRRLHGCLTGLPSTSERVLTLRAGASGRPGLSPGATARVLGVSAGREAHLERVALSSLEAAGRAGCGSAGTPTVLAVAATHTLVASPPAFGPTTGVAAGHPGTPGSAAGTRTQTGGVTRSGVHRPGKGGAAPTRTVERAATEVNGTPAWAVILALSLLALAGAAAVVRQAVLGRRAGVAAAGGAPLPVSPSAAAFAALPAVQTPAPASSDEPPHTADRWLPAELAAPSRPAPPEPASSAPSLTPAPTPGTGLEPARSSPSALRGIRRHTRLAAVLVTALAGGIARLLSRRRTGRH